MEKPRLSAGPFEKAVSHEMKKEPSGSFFNDARANARVKRRLYRRDVCPAGK